MTLAIIYSRAATGVAAPLVTVETHLSYSTPKFNIVGLPEAAVKESRDRVRSAIINSHLDFPTHHITVNLAPADLPKEGGRFDLAIALGILAASKQIPTERLTQFEFLGELALSGQLRSVYGMLSVVLKAKECGRQLIVPVDNAQEAALVKNANVLAAKHLLDVCAYLKGKLELVACEWQAPISKFEKADLSDVKGQSHAKRALEVAAAGKHSILFTGPPGTGKTMLASRLATILPEMTEEQALECAAVASISKRGFDPNTWQQLPFRAPHHTSSSVALVGGGRPPRPGEISLAHHGVLFLDELPEYNRHVLECLREPLESGCITISRAAIQIQFPAQFQLVAAMNPCPCGYAGNTEVQPCRCNVDQIKRYRAKISGPLLDRIDMQVSVSRITPELLSMRNVKEESSAIIRARVLAARERQLERQGKTNHALTVSELEKFAAMEPQSENMLQQIMAKFNLSARAYHRTIKVARTLADLDACRAIDPHHISEAFNYRNQDACL